MNIEHLKSLKNHTSFSTWGMTASMAQRQHIRLCLKPWARLPGQFFICTIVWGVIEQVLNNIKNHTLSKQVALHYEPYNIHDLTHAANFILQVVSKVCSVVYLFYAKTTKRIRMNFNTQIDYILKQHKGQFFRRYMYCSREINKCFMTI